MESTFYFRTSIFKIMKFFVFFMIIPALQISAKGISQTITYSAKNVAIEKVFNEIKKQSGYVFFYSYSNLKEAKPVSIELNNSDINKALITLFKDQPFQYMVDGKLIVVKPIVPNNPTATSLLNAEAPLVQIDISGKVLDDTGNPLIGATIKVKGFNKATQTDASGSFILKGLNEGDLVDISYIGFQTITIRISKSSKLFTIDLKKLESKLDDVVVIGYGSVKRADLTGSVSSIKSEDIVKNVDVSLNNAVQGRLSGVQVITTDGAPGAESSLSIRGGSSISASNEPLYVIDGFPQFGGSNLNINPGDIESIEVLKDASATAIYGSRGANGVVIITTKKAGTNKFSINYDSYLGNQSIVKKLPVLSPMQYAQTQHYILSSPSGSNTDQVYANWPTYKDSASVDWQDLIYNSSTLQNHNLSFSGGTKDLKLSGSLSYTGQDGIAVGTNYERYSGRINGLATLNSFITSGTNIYLSYSNTIGPSLNGETGIAYAILQARPIVPNGNLESLLDQALIGDLGTNNVNNPLTELTRPKLNNNSFVANFNTYLQFAILKGLTLKLSLGSKFQQNKNSQFYPSNTAPGRTANGSARISNDDITDWLNENTLTYNKEFNANNVLNLLAGFTIQDNVLNNTTVRATNFSIQNLGYDNLALGAGLIPPTSNYINQGLESFLGRMNYSFKKRYLFTASIRSDGSSKFQEDKWSIFPSTAFAWKISDENFMEKVTFISTLKLRTSWGKTGNQSIAPYSTYTKFQAYNPIINEQLNVGLAPLQLGNKSLKWETTIQSDLGIDLGLFKDRIVFTVDAYLKKSKDLLLNSPISLYSGYTTVFRNIGDIEVKGLEIDIKTINTTGALKWSSSFNIALNRSKVIALNDNQTFFTTGILGRRVLGQYLVKVGEPLGEMYGYKQIGFFKTQEELVNGAQISGASSIGSRKYEDISGPKGVPDGKIDQNDLTAIGNGNPLFFGGLSNDITYKNFDLSVLFTYSYGNKLINSLKSVLSRPQAYRSGLETIMNAWSPENLNGTEARWGTTNTEYDINSSYQVEDGSFLKLKNILLGYNFPKKMLQKASIKKLRVYFGAANLWVLTDYSGYDPEVSYFNSIITPGADMGAYPKARTFTFGINLGL